MGAKRIDREQILTAAIKLIDDAGLEGLSMRRLGSALGVEAMALYRHFPNKAELLDGVHLRLLNEMEVPGSVAGLTWQEAVRHAASSFRQVLRDHPESIPLMASRAAVHPESLNYLQGGLMIFTNSGFPPDFAMSAFQSIFCFISGHAAFHFARRGIEPEDARVLYEPYPLLAAASDLQYSDPDHEFEFGLSVLISGLEAQLQARQLAGVQGGRRARG